MTGQRARKAKPKHDDEQLDRVFFALSDPVRRAILSRLESEDLLVSELAQPFAISLQAVSRHIHVLERAGMVEKERTGRISRCRLEVGPIADVAVWINHYSKYWQDHFERLTATVDEMVEREGEGAANKHPPKRPPAKRGRKGPPRNK